MTPMARLFSLFILFAGLIPLAAQAESTQPFSTRDGGDFNVLMGGADDAPTAVILFPGGAGKVKIRDGGRIAKTSNFLVVTRGLFADAGFRTAVIDAPADHYDGRGMHDGYRLTKEHAKDVGVVIAHLRGQGAAKVWLVGTSRGSISAAATAAQLGAAPAGPDGLVLTASVIVPGGNPETTLDAETDRIGQPVLIAHHEKDGCVVSPYNAIEALQIAFPQSSKVASRAYSGGTKGPKKQACKGKSHHGFLGLQDRVVGDIADWIKAH